MQRYQHLNQGQNTVAAISARKRAVDRKNPLKIAADAGCPPATSIEEKTGTNPISAPLQ